MDRKPGGRGLELSQGIGRALHLGLVRLQCAVEQLNLFGLIGKVRHPDLQKIRINGYLFEYRLHWQFEVRLSLFTVCTYV